MSKNIVNIQGDVDCNKINIIDNIKTIMMLAVVFYHSCCFFTGNWFDVVEPAYKSNIITHIAYWLNTFHVQTFTMTSGFLFYALRKKYGKYNNFNQDFVKRTRRLLVPYFCTLLVWVIPFYIYYNGFNIDDIFYKYVLGNAPSQLWFLPMLFILFVVFYGVLKERFVSLNGLIIVALISIVGGYVTSKLGFNYFQISAAIRYAGYYYLGAYLYEKNCKKCRWYYAVILGLSSVLTYIATITIEQYFTKYVLFKMFGILLNYICSYFGILFVYFLIIKMTEKSSGLFSKISRTKLWKLLIENSFGIYLFHQQIIYLTIILLNGRVIPIVQVFLSFSIAIVVTSFMVIILRKFKITRLLFSL